MFWFGGSAEWNFARSLLFAEQFAASGVVREVWAAARDG